VDNKFHEKILLPNDNLEILTEAWKMSLPGGNLSSLTCRNQLQLLDRDSWQALSVDALIALCRRWKQSFLKHRPDKNAGSLEWLFCVLRHNATNYDEILQQTADGHSWAPGFGSLLRLRADCLIVSHFRNRELYDELTKQCQAEWTWQHR
jgi:hypothetical protein